MKSKNMLKYWTFLMLALTLMVFLCSCGGNETSIDDEAKESSIIAQGMPNAGASDGKLAIDTDIYVDTLTMNNYMQGESGFLSNSTHLYFSDDFFCYSLDCENGEVTKELRNAPEKDWNYNELLVGDTVFTNQGKLYQFSNPNTQYQLIGEICTDNENTHTELNSLVLPYGDKIIYVADAIDGSALILIAPTKDMEEIDDWSFAEEGDGNTYVVLKDSEVVYESENPIYTIGVYGDILLTTDEYNNIWAIDLSSYESTKIVDGTEIQASWAPKKVVVSGDYLYFSNDIDHKIERIHFDGTGRETFLDGMYGAGRSLYNCDSKNFYHIDRDESAGEYNLYCTKIDDPSESIVLATGYNEGVIPSSEPGLIIAGDSVYYATFGWWKANIDGSGAEFIRYAAVDEYDTGWNLEDLQCQSIAVGYEHTVALKADGSVLAVGKNEHGECNVSNWKDIISIYAAEDQTIGVKSNGQILLAGVLWENESLSALRYATQIDIATGLMAAVKADGSAVCKGTSSVGANHVDDWTDIDAISTSGSHTVGLKSDGTVIAIGSNNQGQCNVEEWTNITKVVAIDGYTVGLEQDGSLITTLRNKRGDVLNIDWSDIVDFDASSRVIVGIKSDGTVLVMVRESILSEWSRTAVLSGWTEIVDIVCTPNYVVGLRSDGTVVASGDTTYAYKGVSEWHDIKIVKN